MTSIKERLHSCCQEYVRQRIANAEEAIAGAQLSANEETKSSAGDKYETGRAMAQLEIEKNTAQLAESKKLMQSLELINNVQTEKVQPGNLVVTNQGNFYIAISAGQFVIDGKTYFAISPASPIGKNLIGMITNNRFTFNMKEFFILEIH